MFTPSPGATFITVTGVTKSHGARAVRWLANRSLASWWSPTDRSLNAFEWKCGPEESERKLRDALNATKSPSLAGSF